MIWPWFSSARSMTKRERKLAEAKLQERARERAEERALQDRAVEEKKRASWERMKADIARKHESHA